MNRNVQQALAAIGEPNRFRILELLAARPYSVGELAEALGALQPQTTKHLQALEAAAVVEVHRLGRRRVARLRRDTLQLIGRYFSDLTITSADDAALEDYQRAVDREEAAALSPADRRSHRFTRRISAVPAEVLDAWIRPERAARWWAPRHFTVKTFELSTVPGGPIRVVLSEPGGADYESRGEFIAFNGHGMEFSLAPLDARGRPLFSARYTLVLSGDGPLTLNLSIDVQDIRPEAAPAVAGLGPGWNQLLTALEEHLRTWDGPAA